MELASAIISLLVGVAVFITGMNMMSGGLKKATGKGVKRLFKKTQNSSIVGMGIGAVVTALIQSSAATSVMAIGFINAGVMTVFQGVAIMMGAYIGTTATGILVSLSSFSFTVFLTAFAFIGLVLMFFKNQKIKHIGEILCGFGLIFFGLSCMSGAFKNNAEINEAFNLIFSNVSFPLLLLFIGIVLTVIMQSSSAVTGVALVMVGSGVMPFSSALYVTLGATIGTFITTLIATIGANINAKRAGMVAFFIKVIAGFGGLAILWIFEAPLVNFFQNSFGSEEMGIALFLVFFNVIFMFALLPTIRPLEKLANVLVKDKDAEKKKKQLLFIDDRLINQPEVALTQAKQEVIHMYNLSKENFIDAFQYLVNGFNVDTNLIVDKEATIDYINTALTDYLVKLSGVITEKDNAKMLGSYFHVINDIERIGDHAYNFYESRLDMIDKELEFSEHAKGELNHFYDLIMRMFDLALEVFSTEKEDKLKELHDIESETDSLNHEYASNHYMRIQKGQCNNSLSPYFSTLLSELERVSDHLTNIGYSIVNPVGDDE